MKLRLFSLFILTPSLFLAAPSHAAFKVPVPKEKDEEKSRNEHFITPSNPSKKEKKSRFSVSLSSQSSSSLFSSSKKRSHSRTTSTSPDKLMDRTSLPPKPSPKLSPEESRRASVEVLEMPTKFTEENKQRQKLYTGKTTEQALAMQLKDSDWYTRNFARCFNAIRLREDDPIKALESIVLAYEEGYAPATFELARRSLAAGYTEKAASLLWQTCQDVLDHEEDYDDQARSELLKSIYAFSKKDTILVRILRMFRIIPLFKEKEEKKIYFKPEVWESYNDCDDNSQPLANDFLRKKVDVKFDLQDDSGQGHEWPEEDALDFLSDVE